MSLYLLLDLTSELWTGCQCMSFVEHYHFFCLVLLVLSLGKVGSSRLLGSQLVRKVRVVSWPWCLEEMVTNLMILIMLIWWCFMLSDLKWRSMGCLVQIHGMFVEWLISFSGEYLYGSLLQESMTTQSTHVWASTSLPYTWDNEYIGVSNNRGTPKSSILMNFPL